MSALSFPAPSLALRLGRPSGILVAFGCVMSLLAGGGSARAQSLTTTTLLGDAVSPDAISQYKDVDEAIQRFLNRDVLAARQFLETAKKKDPSLPPVDLLLAKMYLVSGNGLAGRVSLEKTATDNPGDPEPALMLAEQAVQQGRMIEAAALYEQASELTSKFNGSAKRKRNFEIRALAGRASVNQRRKNWDTAASDLKTLLKSDPDNARAHFSLGQTMFWLKQFPQGYEEFKTAKQKDPKNLPDENVATALMYDQLKMPEKAQQFFDRALAGANKTDVNTVLNYSQWLVKTANPGNIAKAESLLADARKANPGNLNLLILSGVAARMNKKMKPAEDYFVEALGIAPSNGDVINQLALLLIEQSDDSKRDRARQFAAMSAQLNNQSADAQVTLAWVLAQLGRTTDAEQVIRNGLQLGNLGPDSQYLAARYFAETNRPDAAKQLLKSALETESPGIFVYRQEAQTLNDKLNKS